MNKIKQCHITDVPSEGNDMRVRSHVLPVRIVWSQGIIKNPEALLGRGMHAPCVLESTTEQQASILLDFGCELNGGISINLGYPSKPEQSVMRVRFGESVSEAMGDPNDDHAIHDWQVSLPALCVQELGLTGFRFVRIDLLSAPLSCEVRGILAVSLVRPVEELGQFECSDEKLNKIWQVGRRTVHLCMQNYLLDGIKRDRMVWMGDIHSQIGVVQHAFGAQKIIEESLDIIRDCTPENEWMNGIPAYSAWWLISQRDWFMYTAHEDYLRAQQPYFSSLARKLAGMVNDQGRLDWQDRELLDWASARDAQATMSGLQSLGCWALMASVDVARVLDDQDLAQACAGAVNKMRQINLPQTGNKQAMALRILTGACDARKGHDDVLAKNPAAGLSPWFGLYVLQAYAAAGDAQGALNLMKEYWGGMIDLGATSYWEHFDIEWKKLGSRIDELTPSGRRDLHATTGDHCFVGLRHSLCHGWGSGPVTYLSQYVLGVHPVAAGYGKVRISPMLGDLQWARGVIPTPHGVIRIEHERDVDGRVKTKLELPSGCELE